MTEFQWPWEYTFPPFFTLQPHEETRNQQIKVWSDLFLRYLKHLNKFQVNINENGFPLFYNEALKRRLSAETILHILEQLQRTGHAAPLDKRRVEWQVYWYTLEEYANMVYDWIQQTGQMNTICTLYEIASGDNSEGMEFHGIDEAVLLNAMRVLENKGKCEVVQLDDSYGIKFF
ncbi:PREDICTED: vacuolar protein-sorting-associated protein 25-like [Rhagoletis zephyria]|uniref:vacuolar protein-sorting-associated protein 25-like n=1 Tax=Rhagoletis zephyria TaxID=28612 RepID=UPI0008112318|nr:PREDICTED: vacuolar protein-sorting-associated protein 25-like [Rhagoletis zephyria]XP_017490865.1 PREDICTED: vacuolar protein-sorting-associated protein 25-like [Rhagoletis zephyria]XP_036334439.1 vacuolar protein-sorting-associated protein 25 [Rhagoletis pomonella]